MKTVIDLMRSYVAVSDLCDAYNKEHGTDVKPWECVRCEACMLRGHPDFHKYYDRRFQFAVAILEGRPVFVKDRMYFNEIEVLLESSDPYRNLYFIPTSKIETRRPRDVFYAKDFPNGFTWDKPTRTFTLNGVELPCPLRSEPCVNNLNYSTLCHEGHEFYFEFHEDKQQWRKNFTKLLTEAREKP